MEPWRTMPPNPVVGQPVDSLPNQQDLLAMCGLMRYSEVLGLKSTMMAASVKTSGAHQPNTLR